MLQWVVPRTFFFVVIWGATSEPVGGSLPAFDPAFRVLKPDNLPLNLPGSLPCLSEETKRPAKRE